MGEGREKGISFPNQQLALHHEKSIEWQLKNQSCYLGQISLLWNEGSNQMTSKVLSDLNFCTCFPPAKHSVRWARGTGRRKSSQCRAGSARPPCLPHSTDAWARAACAAKRASQTHAEVTADAQEKIAYLKMNSDRVLYWNNLAYM